MTEMKPKKLFLLDAFALIYRSYFAFIRNPRFNSKGVNTSAMLGFTNTLVQVLESEKPDYIGVAFDVSRKTFRTEMYEAYKANREEMPEDLRKSVPYIRGIIRAFNIPILEMEGYEADDIIGTLAKRAEQQGFQTYMMTPDKDYAQLVSDNIFIYKPGKSGDDAEVWDIEKVKENFGIDKPEQVIDILGLMGDTADNIPGCPGIGPKNAQKLIAEYGSIEGLYEHIDEIKGKQKENLVNFEEQVRLSKKLAVIMKEIPIEFRPEKLIMEKPDNAALKNLFDELEFRTLKQRLKLEEPAETVEQGSLFSQQPVEAEPAASQKYDSIETVPHQYYLIENAMQRASLRAELSVQDEFCFDTETTGLDTLTAGLVCISFAFRKSEAYCVLLPREREECEKVVAEFREVFADERILKIGQNIKYDIMMLNQYHLEVKGKLFDTMLAHYLIQPELKHNLDYLCELYLNYRKIPTEHLIGKKGSGQITMLQVDRKKLRDYACEDADLTLQLKHSVNAGLDKYEVRRLFEEIEMPLVPVLADMETTGVKLNTGELKVYAAILRERILSLESDIISLAGEEFNVSSPKQLGPILFEKLKIDTNVRKTKTKQYSTSEDVLIRLTDRHPIVGKILEYRGAKKLLSTYVEALPALINPKTGKIHTSYNQAVAATGRLSSNNPNLQNIPIRDAEGREIRKAFVPTDDKYTFLSADYSQIELRIIAALSEDKAMIRAFSENQDIHSLTAAKIYGVGVEQVTTEQRRKAKTANFGIIYGISAFGLSQRLNIPRGEAKQLIDGYFESFPMVKAFMDRSIRKARETGYVQTIFGRKRYLNDINSANAVVRGLAERNAINAPIQGSAADIIKIAMINIHKKMTGLNLQSKMILQVHDELNFDVLLSELETVKEIVKTEMENAADIGVPLIVDMKNADNWLDAH